MTPWLLVFARDPEPGRAKTRLAPELGAEGAAALYRAFLEDTLRTVVSVPGVRPVLFVERSSSVLDDLAARFGIGRELQPDGDLGARLRVGFERGLVKAPWCIAVGSDAPTLPGALIRDAARLLGGDRADVVLGPAADGGYYLLGLRRPHPDLFAGIPWSEAGVFAETRSRALSLGLRVSTLPPWYDVDTPADLRCLRAHVAFDPERAPATAHHLLTPPPRAM